MPFIPHTEKETEAMLSEIGADDIQALFDEIPDHLKLSSIDSFAPGLSEMEATRLYKHRAHQNQIMLCFAGAGAYEHHIPAAVWEVATRGEYMTAYTPYQPEVSQGGLQLLYEYQTMMASLTGLDVSNASHYDGASVLAEAILMAIRANRRSKSMRVLFAGTIHPHYRETVEAIVQQQNVDLIVLPFCETSGVIDPESLNSYEGQDIAALVIPQPNFFGRLEAVDQLTDWAHQQKALVIAAVNPIALALLKEPGSWGQIGADIACGEGQPLGLPLASGGPYFGFLCCKQAYVRQMPGRIVGCTHDETGKEGFVLTLQAREQHIRRAKATSNICTNQGLMTVAATIYMSLMGPEGLKKVALSCHANTQRLLDKLLAIDGVTIKFVGPFFHEFVICLSKPVSQVLAKLSAAHIQAGIALEAYFPALSECLLLCVTETKSEQDLDFFAEKLKEALIEIDS